MYFSVTKVESSCVVGSIEDGTVFGHAPECHSAFKKGDFIHLLPSLEGDTKICPTQKIHETRRFVPPRKFMSPEGEARG